MIRFHCLSHKGDDETAESVAKHIAHECHLGRERGQWPRDQRQKVIAADPAEEWNGYRRSP
jgi:hypothetical protein